LAIGNQVSEFENICININNSLSNKKYNKSDPIGYQEAKKVGKFILRFNEETHGFFFFGIVNCTGEQNENFCSQNFKIKKYPSLILLKSTKSIEEGDEIKKVLYENLEERLQKGLSELSLEYSDIESEIKSNYEGKLREANQNTIQSILAEVNMNKKLAAIYLFDTSVQLSINLLSSDEKLNQIFEFIVFYDPPEEMKNNLKVTKLPAFTIAIPTQQRNDALQMILYPGKLLILN